MDPIQFLIENGAPKGRGRPAPRPVNMTMLRELDEGDLPDLLNPPPQPQVTTIARLRHRHHSAARLLAEGRKPQEVALITGYSFGHINGLQSDPAFEELVHYYSTQLDAKYINVHERLAALSAAAVEELQDRMETAPDKFTKRELLEVASMALDRTGFAPKTNNGPGTGGSGNATLNITFVSPEGQTAGVTLDGEAL
jgi:hypothetical protein